MAGKVIYERHSMNSILRTAALSIVVAISGSMVVARNFDKDKGFAAFQAGDYATALKEWRPQAEQGISSAYINLGILYAEGKGVLKDPITAHMWYNKAYPSKAGSSRCSVQWGL